MSLARLRERCGLSIAEVSNIADVSERTVRRWVNGESKPPKLVLEKLTGFASEKEAKERRQAGFTFVDFFAGIGGMRMAFEAVGGRCKATCEWDKYARHTYAANFALHSDEPFYGDVRTITADPAAIRDIPDHDIFVAGFPCQPFSIAGVSKKNALGDAHGFACEAQGTLFFEIAKIIRAKQPKAFLLENVKNLLSHDGGKTFRVIMNVLRTELGYAFIDHRVVDAKGFVPQHRERTLIVGFRDDVGFSWNDVKFAEPANGPRLAAVLHSSEEVPDGRFTLGPKFRVNPKYTLSEHLWGYLQDYAAKHKAAGNGFGFGLVGPKDVARTLSARYYKDGSEILVRHRDAKKPPRRLTPRECSRLMGFDRAGRPEFRIDVSDTQAYKQFGNAVVVPVVEAVATAMVERLADPNPVRTKQMEFVALKRVAGRR